MNSDTPRTDAELEDARNVALEFTCQNPAPKEGQNIYVVSADFARTLERECNVLRIEYESRAEWIAKMLKNIHCDNPDGFHCVDAHKVAEAMLMCVEALRQLEHVSNVMQTPSAVKFANDVLIRCSYALTAYDDATKGKTK